MSLWGLVVLTNCVMHVWYGSWFWLYDALDVNRDVKAAPLPTVESAEAEQNEDSDDDDKDADETNSKEKKKRIGFRDRKVDVTAAISNPCDPYTLFTARHCASVVYAVVNLSVCVSLFVTPSHGSIVSKRGYIGRAGFFHTGFP